ncbi:MAG: hypothetical protein ABIL86_05800 [candidate division WOR-3 bacterium]
MSSEINRNSKQTLNSQITIYYNRWQTKQYDLVMSSDPVGTDYKEGNESLSKKAFCMTKEGKESRYWLKLGKTKEEKELLLKQVN